MNYSVLIARKIEEKDIMEMLFGFSKKNKGEIEGAITF